jgi:protein tyrosine/serine phosphatase
VTPYEGAGDADTARRIEFDGPANFRDLGGYVATNGAVVRRGQLFRSDSLHRFSDEDLVRFATLGIRTVFDLRGPAERQLEPNRVPNIHLDINSAHLSAEPSRAGRRGRHSATGRSASSPSI